jgi:3-deoxy-D-manno-octulosonic-acid transferase
MAMKVHTLLRQQYPHALLIIAPRAPARGPEIQALCPNGSALRSASCTLPALNDAVYVADTIGEMGLWYRLAPVAMLGGSWVAVGGHNPHEALALGCRVLHGPHVSNFAESYEDLDAQGLSQAVIKVSDLAQSISRIWTLAPVPAPVSIGPTSTLEPWQSLIALAQD